VKATKKTPAAKKPVNHGARQPVLSLPTEMPGGRMTTDHPLLWAMTYKMPRDTTKSDIARTLGIKPQSLYKWEAACRRDRNFPVPILRAAQLAKVFRIPASLLRPDAYKPKETK
jgi:DNA-binding XRE family transcriptional regulator